MSSWVWRGLKTPLNTTRYPFAPERAPGVSPGLPRDTTTSTAQALELAARCPTGALRAADGRVIVDPVRCVHSFRCARGVEHPIDWTAGYEWALTADGSAAPLDRAFRGSAHILVVDAGDCGACLSEVKQLNNPYYNMHRLGFFITPTPRQADILLVVGPVTMNMRWALLQAYDAMPTPKRVMAVGTCAASGGVFEHSFASGNGVHEFLPVDVTVPGSPPPPLAILHGLLVLTGRAVAAGSTAATAAEGAMPPR